MYYSEEVIQELCRKSDIKKIISEYTDLKNVGGVHAGRCPFHREYSYNFIVDTHSQTYQCLSCGRGGNVIDFVMRINKVDFKGAVEWLANKAGIFLPEINVVVPEQEQRLKVAISRMNREAAKYYSYLLRKADNPGLAYFRNRGLTEETINKFGLGYANDFKRGLYRHLISTNFTNDEILASGLVGYGLRYQSNQYEYYDKFRDRVMFPIMDNSVMGFGGRVLGDEKPKYLNSSETVVFEKNKVLYGYNFAKNSKKDYVVLCEGYMDVIAMHQAGFDTAVASLGTAFTSGQADLIADVGKKVFIAYDSDTAGINAAIRAIPILESRGISAGILHLNPCKDPDEFLKTFGKSALEERFADAETSDHFKIRVLKTNSESDDAFYSEAAEMLLNYL